MYLLILLLTKKNIIIMRRFFLLFVVLIAMIASCSKEVEPAFAKSTFGDGESLPKKVIDAQVYEAFPISKRTIFFHEDFTANTNGWILQSPMSSIVGGLFLSNGRNVLISILKTIDETKDFEVETRIGFKNLVNNNNGVLFNYNNTTKKYWGFFNAQDPNNVNAKVSSIGLFNNGSLELQTGQKEITNYNTSNYAWSKYTLRKVGEYIITFVDGIKISTKKYTATQGTRLGINDPGGIGVDNIYIDYLN
jgi:hypothetical protein